MGEKGIWHYIADDLDEVSLWVLRGLRRFEDYLARWAEFAQSERNDV